MSNGTLNTNNEADFERGYEDGELWIYVDASPREKARILSIHYGDTPCLSFANCGNAHEAIHEFVRRIHPPCGLHCDSATEYWRLIGYGGPCSKQYVVAFWQGAREILSARMFDEACDNAQNWIETGASPEELNHAEQFAVQHGDTWESEYPEGCDTVFDVGLLMAGPSPTPSYLPHEETFHIRFGLYGFSALVIAPTACDVAHAKMFISSVVYHLRRRRTETPELPSNEPPRIEPNERQPLHILLRERGLAAEGNEGTPPPPTEDEQT